MYIILLSKLNSLNKYILYFKGGALGKNHKRVMDVWMDEYKEFIYVRRPHYRNIDPGNVQYLKDIFKLKYLGVLFVCMFFHILMLYFR